MKQKPGWLIRKQRRLSTPKRRLVHATGPVPCAYMIVGEAPGPREHARGLSFVGPSGQILDSLLLATCRLTRDDVWVGNLYPYWLGAGNPDPSAEQIVQEEWRLLDALEELRPRYVLAVGRLAARWFLGDVDLESCHGVAFVDHYGRAILPAYHPANYFHRPEMAAACLYDFRQFGALIHGKLKPRPLDAPYKPLPARLDSTRRVVADLIFVDTEGSADSPWGLSWTTSPNWSRVIQAGQLQRQGGIDFDGTVVLHNSIHDLPVLRVLGARLLKGYIDSMVMAYLLRVEPQALKQLAFRHCGLRMREFTDVVRPYHRRAAFAYLARALQHSYDPVEEELLIVNGRPRVKRPHAIGTRLRTIMTAAAKNRALDLEERWNKLPSSYQSQIERAVGERFPTATLHLVPAKEAIEYSGADAAATCAVYPHLQSRIEAAGLMDTLSIDMGAIPMIDAMQRRGLAVDLDHFEKLGPQFDAGMLKLEEDIALHWNDRKPINLRSGDQVAALLYERLKLRSPKLTDTGTRGATDEKTLELLAATVARRYADLLAHILEHRELAKLRGTYVDGLVRWARPDPSSAKTWRIRPNYRSTRTETGRLSTADPNLMAIPVRSKLGKEIRRGFIAPLGFSLWSFDFSQIELRVLAHCSQDRHMLLAFRKGVDIHAQTSRLLFGSEDHRYEAKSINFAIVFGISPMGLLRQFRAASVAGYNSENDAARVIAAWFDAYPGVAEYMRRIRREARARGCVRTIFGRLRYIPEAYSPHEWQREAGYREGCNFPIQGGAQDIMKRAMARVWCLLEKSEGGLHPLLQIHDELLFEVAQHHKLKDIGPHIAEIMVADQSLLSVPLAVNYAEALTWGDIER